MDYLPFMKRFEEYKNPPVPFWIQVIVLSTWMIGSYEVWCLILDAI